MPKKLVVILYAILAYQIWYSIRTNDIYQTALWGVVLGIQINMTIVSLQLGRKKKEKRTNKC